MNYKKIKMISISGSGRSGTTLLSLLISQHKGIYNLGQIRNFWKAFASDATCSCAKRLTECPFWSRVMEIQFGAFADMEMLKVHGLMTSFMRDAAQVYDWADHKNVVSLKNKHGVFLNFLETFLRNCQIVTGRDVFVDTSKSPEIALAFFMLPNIELYVVNLVRDPRAVVCSWHKKKPAISTMIRFSKVWRKRQNVLEKWAGGTCIRFIQIRYEFFVKTPREMVESILTWVEMKCGMDCFISEITASVTWTDQHVYPPSNEHILEQQEKRINIVAHDKWKKIKNLPIHLITLFCTFPTGLYYILCLKFLRNRNFSQ